MNSKFSGALLVLVSGSVLMAGCSSAPKSTPALDSARTALATARENPDVLRYAAENVDRAGQTLERAASARDVDDMNSLAYVANAQVQTAEAIARRRIAENKVQELSGVKEKVQLEVRDAELAATQRRLDASKEQLAELQAEQTNRGTVVTLGNVLFTTGKSELLPGAMGSIDRLAEYLRDNAKSTVLIEGHTDSTGSNEINMRLSQARADSVRMALLSRGIEASRLSATGLSSSQPVASNATAEGRQQNRRVEVIIR